MENKTSDVQRKCQGPLLLLSPPFLMTSTTKQMQPHRMFGQALTTKQQQWTYITLQQNKTKMKNAKIHTEHTIHEKPRINKQDRQKITFPGSAYPKEISQQYTLATHAEAVHCHRIVLGCSILICDHRRLLDPPWGEHRQTFRQPTYASTSTMFSSIVRTWTSSLTSFRFFVNFSCRCVLFRLYEAKNCSYVYGCNDTSLFSRSVCMQHNV